MPYLITNPAPDQLLEHVTLRTKEDPAVALGRLQSGLEAGRSKIEDLWMLIDGSRLWATFSLVKTGEVRRCILRTEAGISDEALTELLRWLQGRAEQSGEELIVHFSTTTARDAGDLPLQLGWIFESHALMHRTPLRDRFDLAPDPAGLRFELSELQTPRFAGFYAPIWEAQAEQFSATLEEAIEEYHGRFSSFENPVGYYLIAEGGAPIGAGLLRTFMGKVTIDVIGVLPKLRGQGWGNRLHRHLLWAAKGLADLHEGGTDYSNAAMRRLLEKNGCVIDEEQWAFAFKPLRDGSSTQG